eukprot:15075764-Alexandrium_andersonii.AAC.3
MYFSTTICSSVHARCRASKLPELQLESAPETLAETAPRSSRELHCRALCRVSLQRHRGLKLQGVPVRRRDVSKLNSLPAPPSPVSAHRLRRVSGNK